MITIARKYLALFVCLLIFTQCQKTSDPAFSNNQERLVQVYVELIKLREKLPIQDSVYIDSSRAILQKYHFTKEEYDRSLSYMNERPERWQTFYQKVLEQLEDK